MALSHICPCQLRRQSSHYLRASFVPRRIGRHLARIYVVLSEWPCGHCVTNQKHTSCAGPTRNQVSLENLPNESIELSDLHMKVLMLFSDPKSVGVDNFAVRLHGVMPRHGELQGTAEPAGTMPIATCAYWVRGH